MQDIFGNSLRLIVEKFVLGIPNLLMAIIITVIGLLLAKFIAKMVTKILETIGIDRFGDMFNQLPIIAENNIEIKISSILSKFIYYFLILIFLVAATDVLQMEALSNLVSNAIEFIPNLVVALAVFVIGLLGADKLRVLVLTTCESLGIPSAKTISSAIFYFVFITIFVMALSQAQIDTDFLSQNISIIIAGVVLAFSIGYGLASKDVVANYLAAHTTKGRYNIGDRIVMKDVSGEIESIDKNSVVIRHEEGRTVVPIAKLIKENITIKN